MPTTTTLVLFALSAVALIAIPGPNLIYIVTQSVGGGRRAGIASALGVEAGTLVHVAAAAAGVSALIASSVLAFNIVRYLGAAYLFYLGIRALRSKETLELASTTQRGARHIFAQGMMVNVLNPKVALFFLAFLPQFTDPSRGAVVRQTLILGAVFFAIALAMDILYAGAASAIGSWVRSRTDFDRRRRYFVGTVYLALGAAALIGGSHRR